MVVEFNEVSGKGCSHFAEQSFANVRIGIDDAVGRPVDEHAPAFSQEVWRRGIQNAHIPARLLARYAENADESFTVRLRVAAEQEADAFLHKLTHGASVAKVVSSRQGCFAFADVAIWLPQYTVDNVTSRFYS